MRQRKVVYVVGFFVEDQIPKRSPERGFLAYKVLMQCRRMPYRIHMAKTNLSQPSNFLDYQSKNLAQPA